MYDIKALEEEWKKYNRNKKKPFYLLLGLLFGVIFLGLFLYKNKSFSFYKNVNSGTIISNQHIQSNSLVLLDNKLLKLLVEPQNKIEEKNLEKKEIINDIGEQNINVPTLPIVNNIPVIDDVPVGKIVLSDKPKVKTNKKSKIILSNKPRKKMHLNIIESSSVSAYSDVEKRFKQSHDTDDSLFLAKSYYRKGNYHKAEYWALQTNKVNSSLEESWLIYVKSKAKLGHKNEAIRILTNYAKRSNSSSAWNLLLKLKK